MPHPKILIVDDEPANIDYLEQELEGLSYATVSAANGQEALDKVRSEAPDLILLDIMMPVMDGFEALSRLKADPATRDIPVIVISASSDLQSVVKGVQIGAEDYLPKPFEPTLLLARVSSSLEKKRLRDLQQLYLKSLERELEIGREIQKSFLPAQLPAVDGWEFAAYFKAAREVTGDFYDAFRLPDGNLACVIGDVCGKGVGAALFMTLFRSLIRVTFLGAASRRGRNSKALTPAERLQGVVSFTNRYVTETHGDENMFATVFIATLNLQDGALTYINCGNESPLLLREGRVIATLKPTGPVVGVISEAKFSTQEFLMEANDLLLAYTDGIPDALDAHDVSFGHERLVAAVEGSAAAPPALLGHIQTQLLQFIGAADQFDDITLLAIKKCRGDACVALANGALALANDMPRPAKQCASIYRRSRPV